MKAVRTRVAVLLIVGLAALGLSACQAHTGAAAIVGGERISEKSVENYIVTPGVANSRRLVVTYLVKQALYERWLTDHGGLPSEAELTKLHDQAMSFGFTDTSAGTSIGTGAAADANLDAGLKTVSVKSTARPVIVRSLELEVSAISRLKATEATAFFTQIRAAGISVSVSPRYGSWEPSVMDLRAPVTPDFLKPAATSSAAAG